MFKKCVRALRAALRFEATRKRRATHPATRLAPHALCIT